MDSCHVLPHHVAVVRGSLKIQDAENRQTLVIWPHHTTLSGYIFNMVTFGQLAAEIVCQFGATLQI